MIRCILFRGKHLDSGDWVEGSYIKAVHLDNEVFHFIRSIEMENMGYSFKMYKVCPDSVGQFIGVEDRNNVRIFEGDLVRLYQDWDSDSPPYTDGIVRYSEHNFYIEQIVTSDNCINAFYDPMGRKFSWSELEVIGNSYGR